MHPIFDITSENAEQAPRSELQATTPAPKRKTKKDKVHSKRKQRTELNNDTIFAHEITTPPDPFAGVRDLSSPPILPASSHAGPDNTPEPFNLASAGGDATSSLAKAATESGPQSTITSLLPDFRSLDIYPTQNDTPPKRRHSSREESTTQRNERTTLPTQDDSNRTPEAVRSSSRQPSISLGPRQTVASPPPHLPQAHFYTAPGLNLEFSPSVGSGVSTSARSFRGFDKLPFGEGQNDRPVDCLLVGWNGGLDILRVKPGRLDLIGRISGLRGMVIGAKILPLSFQNFDTERSPLIALAVHGRQIVSSSREDDEQGNLQSQRRGSQTHSSQSKHNEGTPGQNAAYSSHCLTTVEVYTLSEGRHLATLFSAAQSKAPSQPEYAQYSHSGTAPLPNELRLDAAGHFLTVTFPMSGEVYIYSVESAPEEGQGLAFRCLGKVWTGVHARGLNNNQMQSGIQSSWTPPFDQNEYSDYSAIISLSQRWLAFVPPQPSSASTAHGTVSSASVSPRSFGISTHAPPAQPSANCSVDVPEGETFFNKFARGATQEVLKGAKWLGDQGLQAFKNYWNKPSNEKSTSTSPPNQRTGAPSFVHGQSAFPPTHAPLTQPSSNSEPCLISILDLEHLANSQQKATSAKATASTFTAPLGCSHLSFAPHGLLLFSASQKGDVQFVWDVLRTTSSPVSQNILRGSRGHRSDVTSKRSVRQVARFHRLTTTNIAEVTWLMPRGDRLAVVTERGTVHVLTLPSQAFEWPPLRRMVPSASANTQQISNNDDSEGKIDSNLAIAGQSVSAAFKILGDSTQPIIAAARNRRRSSGSKFSGVSGKAVAGAGVQGSKYVTSRLSKSLGAANDTFNHIRGTEDVRLRLTEPPSTGQNVAWLACKNFDRLATVSGSCLRIHQMELRPSNSRSKPASISFKRKASEFDLPDPRMQGVVPPVAGWDKEQASEKPQLGSFWQIRVSEHPKRHYHSTAVHPLSFAEIETNAPYQPFHTDRRTAISVFEEATGVDDSQHSNEDSEAWVFGNDLQTRRLKQSDLTDDGSQVNRRVESVFYVPENADEEQIVVTTRRTRKPRQVTGGSEEDGFFEDDCEVLDYASERV